MRDDRLDTIKFPLIAGIVLIHSYHPVLETLSPTAQTVRYFLSNGLANIAVPAFFLVSGYLLFRNTTWSGKVYLSKLKSRLLTIVIPYVIWTVAYWIWMPLTRHIPELLLPQFWYLQELLFLVIVSPVFHLMHKYGAVVFGIALLTAWLFADWSLRLPVLSSLLPATFFYTGSVLAVRSKSLFLFDRVKWAAVAICLITFWADAVGQVRGEPNTLLHKVGIIAGVIAVLGLSANLMSSRFNKQLQEAGKATFFIFAFHQPLIQILMSWAVLIYAPQGDFGKMALYLLSPVLMLLLSVWAFRKLAVSFPRFTAVITGGRF